MKTLQVKSFQESESEDVAGHAVQKFIVKHKIEQEDILSITVEYNVHNNKANSIFWLYYYNPKELGGESTLIDH